MTKKTPSFTYFQIKKNTSHRPKKIYTPNPLQIENTQNSKTSTHLKPPIKRKNIKQTQYPLEAITQHFITHPFPHTYTHTRLPRKINHLFRRMSAIDRPPPFAPSRSFELQDKQFNSVCHRRISARGGHQVCKHRGNYDNINCGALNGAAILSRGADP